MTKDQNTMASWGAGLRRPLHWQRDCDSLALALTAGLLLGFSLYILLLRPGYVGLDFNVYFLCGARYAAGSSPYTMTPADYAALAEQYGITNYTWPYKYPPLTAALMAQLVGVGVRPLWAVWLLTGSACAVWGTWLVGRSLGGGVWGLVTMGLLLTSFPMLMVLLLGQINAFMFFCFCLAWWAWERERQGLAGFALALGAQIKVATVVVLGLLAWRGRMRGLWAAAVALLLSTALIAPLVGWRENWVFVANALTLITPEQAFASHDNQGFNGFFSRLLPLAPEAVARLATGCGLALVAVVLLRLWPPGRPRGGKRQELLEWGLVMTALHLLPSISWYHQLIMVLPATALALRESWRLGYRRLFYALLGGHLAMSLHQGLLVAGVRAPWALNLPFMFLLGLTLALLFLLWQGRSGAPELQD